MVHEDVNKFDVQKIFFKKIKKKEKEAKRKQEETRFLLTIEESTFGLATLSFYFQYHTKFNIATIIIVTDDYACAFGLRFTKLNLSKINFVKLSLK